MSRPSVRQPNGRLRHGGQGPRSLGSSRPTGAVELSEIECRSILVCLSERWPARCRSRWCAVLQVLVPGR